MSLIDLLQGYQRREDGAVAVIVALMLVVLMGFVALGVDVASLYRDRSNLQSDADLTAVSAMAAADTATPRAAHVLARNTRSSDTVMNLQTGRYVRNPELVPDDRFTPLPEGSEGVNAVRVMLEQDAPLHFARVLSDQSHVTLDRAALATHTGSVSFALDSQILQLDGATLNDALTSQYGVNATVDLGAIQTLADVQINLGQYLAVVDAATGGPRTNPAKVMDVETTVSTLISALQDSLPSGLASALTGLQSATGTAQVDVASIIAGIDTELGLTATGFLSEIEVSALDIVRSLVAAEVAGQSINVGAEISVAGLLGLQTALTIGEPEARSGIFTLGELPAERSGVFTLGEEGATLHHAVARLYNDIEVAPNLLGSLGVGVSVTEINLPLYVEAAGAAATLDYIGCDRGSLENVAARFITAATPLDATNGTSVAALYLGDLPATTGAINPADLGYADLLSLDLTVNLGLLGSTTIPGITIQARSHVAVGGSLSEEVVFNHQDIASGNTVKSFGSGALLTTAVNGLLSPANTDIRIKPGQTGLLSSLTEPLLKTVLATLPDRLLTGLAGPVDAVLDQTLNAVGISLGTGEITLIGHHCEVVKLVQ